jgi:hypothetical protein
LQVQVIPPFPENEGDAADAHQVTATGNGTSMEYRFELRHAGWPFLVAESPWSSSGAFEIDGYTLTNSPGTYQLRVMAREQSNPREVFTRAVTFRTVNGVSEVIRTKNQILVLRNAAKAKRLLVEAFMAVKRRQAASLDLSVLCSELQSSEHVISTRIKPGTAPGGGPAFVPGTGDEVLGAVGIDGSSGCSDPADWSGTEFYVSLPGYPSGDASGLRPQVDRVAYRDVVTAGEMKARFDRTVQRVRDEIALVKGMQDRGEDVSGAAALLNNVYDLQGLLMWDPATELEMPAAPGGATFLPMRMIPGNVSRMEWDLSAGLGIMGLDVNEGASLEDLEIRLEMKPYPANGSGIPAQSAVIRYSD